MATQRNATNKSLEFTFPSLFVFCFVCFKMNGRFLYTECKPWRLKQQQMKTRLIRILCCLVPFILFVPLVDFLLVSSKQKQNKRNREFYKMGEVYNFLKWYGNQINGLFCLQYLTVFFFMHNWWYIRALNLELRFYCNFMAVIFLGIIIMISMKRT